MNHIMFAFFSLKNASINLFINFHLLKFSYNHACDIVFTFSLIVNHCKSHQDVIQCDQQQHRYIVSFDR